MEQVLQPVGVREAKNRFSELAAEVNACGFPLTVLKSGHEPEWDERRSDKDYLGDERMERFG